MVILDDAALEQRVLEPVRRWASAREDLRAVLLVGSYARGAARPGSDVDLVVLVDDPDAAVRDGTLAAALGAVERPALERWGPITALRAFCADGLELELDFGRAGWVTDVPLDAGTARVLGDGARVIVDRLGGLATIVRSARPAVPAGTR